MKSILVTGGAGYIGSKIVTDLIKKKNKVVVVDNLSTGFRKLIHKKAIFYKRNIYYKDQINKIIKKNKINVVIHCAASIDVAESERNKKKYFNNNVRNTENLLKSLQGSNVKYFVFSSSCAVYGGSNSLVSEKSNLKPENYYGETKYLGEQLIKEYSKKLKFKYVLLRYFNVAGSDIINKIGCIRNTNSLFKNLSLSVKNNKFKINVFGKNYKTVDGTCIRDFIHINDISKLHLLSLQRLFKFNKSKIYNCGYGRGFSVYQVVKAFENITKKKFKINFMRRRQGDIPVLFADNTKIKKELNFKLTSNSLEKIIKSSINWEKKHNNYETR